MFGQEFDLIFGIILLVLAFVFFIGKGEGVLNAFNGRNTPRQKKRSPEDERKYHLAIGVYLLLLGAIELGLSFFPNMVLNLISIAVAVIGLILLVAYMRKLDRH